MSVGTPEHARGLLAAAKNSSHFWAHAYVQEVAPLLDRLQRADAVVTVVRDEMTFYVRCGDELHCRICAWLNRLHSPTCTVPRVKAALAALRGPP